jgi:hypothetical protein
MIEWCSQNRDPFKDLITLSLGPLQPPENGPFLLYGDANPVSLHNANQTRPHRSRRGAIHGQVNLMTMQPGQAYWEQFGGRPSSLESEPQYEPEIHLADNNWACPACHRGNVPNPVFPQPPRPTPFQPRGRTPGRGAPPQCAIQNASDARRCNRQPNPTAKAMCWGTAAEREAYCIKSGGEVGWPQLFTVD